MHKESFCLTACLKWYKENSRKTETDQPIDLFHNIDEQPGLPHSFEQNPTIEPTFDGKLFLLQKG